MEPEDSLRMRDEHLDTIPETKSNKFIKSSVENLVPSPIDSEDELTTRTCTPAYVKKIPDPNAAVAPRRYGLDPLLPTPGHHSMSRIRGDILDVTTPLVGGYPHHLNAESDLIESLLNQDSLIISSSKIDSLLDEFTIELILLKSIPPGIDEADCDPKEEIYLIKKFLFNNSSPRSPKEFISKNSKAVVEYFSPSPIPVEDSDSLRDEIDLSLTPDDLMPPGINDDDYDSEGDILEELLSNDSLSLLKNESFHFDIPSSLRPPAKPPDDEEIKPKSRIMTINLVGDISEHYVPMSRLLPTNPSKLQMRRNVLISILIEALKFFSFLLNKTAKDLWDALARHMLGSEYGEQDRKAAVLYEYETFKATSEGSEADDFNINIDALYNILKQNQGDVNDAMGSKKKTVVVTSNPLALIAEKTNVSKSKEKVVVSSDSEGSEADDFSELKKITALLEKAFNQRKFYSKPTDNNLSKNIIFFSKDKDEQVLLAEDQAWMESSSDSDHEINANMVFMAQIEKVLSNAEASSSSADEKISEEKYTKLEAERYEYMIRYSAYFDNDKQHRKQIADQQDLFDKMSVQMDLEIEKCLERLNVCENKLHKMGQTNQTVHMIMPSKDNLYNGRKENDFENPSYFEKAKDLRPTLYDKKVIGLGYTPMFLTHSDEALEIEKFKRSRENKIEFAYDYGNLNASYVNEKINFDDDYFQEIINSDFEKIDSPFQQTSSLKPYVPNVILEKSIIGLEDKV
nr:ATPase, F0 complex, subunit C, mitochondrion, mitochondrial [Tanacetum cinerariifolium]